MEFEMYDMHGRYVRTINAQSAEDALQQAKQTLVAPMVRSVADIEAERDARREGYWP